jgi:LPS-assembly lipoprotein
MRLFFNPKIRYGEGMTKFIALIGLLATLTACGFHPVHGKFSNDRRTDSAPVEITIIPDREGQILRNELIDRLHQNGEPASAQYRLSVDKIQESDKELAITKSSEATRAQLRLKTKMVLTDKSGKEVLVRDLLAITSYNVLQSEFATRVAENTARENALGDLARQIELHLNLYLNRK